MFNRSNPAGLALAFLAVIVMAAAFLALSFGVGATPGHDGVPAEVTVTDHGAPAPDWTYATCDVPAADLPPYTVVHSCVDPTGAIVAR